jgi:hypothetical protein
MKNREEKHQNSIAVPELNKPTGIHNPSNATQVRVRVRVPEREEEYDDEEELVVIVQEERNEKATF